MDPTIGYTLEIVTLTVNVPIGVYKSRTDIRRGDSGDTTFSDFALIISLSVRF